MVTTWLGLYACYCSEVAPTAAELPAQCLHHTNRRMVVDPVPEPEIGPMAPGHRCPPLPPVPTTKGEAA